MVTRAELTMAWADGLGRSSLRPCARAVNFNNDHYQAATGVRHAKRFGEIETY
jgi:hypothetical protein